ncbi:MAG: 50S ribosomal protein L9 [Flavobacteriales bacterium]|nr:50S ribosomal protein L9 [Flavobacteriales bacterium]|tara:strand:- start:5427 stop:5879 length:453 start_codon:yes stop_codon:yes gene_type:complete
MEVILKKDVLNCGFKDDIVRVKDGYARNFLIPQGFAVLANDSTKKILAENLKQRSHKETTLIKDAEELKKKLIDTALIVKAKVSEDGSSLFGSVTSAIFSEKLSKLGFEIDKKYIKLGPSTIIKKLGKYTANIRLHRDVIANLDFEVVKE